MSDTEKTTKEEFIKGLLEYGIVYNATFKKEWYYCGGNTGARLRYWNIACKEYELPAHVDRCVCGHAIKENCYITNGKGEILIIGNHCIKRFANNLMRTCELCKKAHKNRVVNRCNDCRRGLCDLCNRESDPRFKTCYSCGVR